MPEDMPSEVAAPVDYDVETQHLSDFLAEHRSSMAGLLVQARERLTAAQQDAYEHRQHCEYIEECVTHRDPLYRSRMRAQFNSIIFHKYTTDVPSYLEDLAQTYERAKETTAEERAGARTLVEHLQLAFGMLERQLTPRGRELVEEALGRDLERTFLLELAERAYGRVSEDVRRCAKRWEAEGKRESMHG